MFMRVLAASIALVLTPLPAAAQAGLIGRLVGQPFVVPDARGAPVALEFVSPEPGLVEVRIGGHVTDRYSIGPGGSGQHIAASAPDLVSRADFTTDSWARTYRGLTVTYALDEDGDLVGRLSGAVEDWQSPSFVYAHNPQHADLGHRLRLAVERAHEEADRYEGHDHDHGPSGQ
ncbi:hypothetical protein [Phenylobacterium sp. J367]|uniref:hypothetical protein n=1 Tax=Phenylobacterium sp. J367 TaxID=2898435 RepID=UPI002150DE27|nr:hypothetical protein [Phenylobacterium sp. J367]MCR5880675.1 hypothetical protein [Phenylobacterium sp. J367]